MNYLYLSCILIKMPKIAQFQINNPFIMVLQEYLDILILGS